MNAESRRLVKEMMADLEVWVKEIVEQSVTDTLSATALEQRIAREGQRHLCRLLAGTLQLAVDRLEAARTCPQCGGRRRHKGRRVRTPVSRLGAIRLEGIYWHCVRCGRGQHAADAVLPGSFSGWMRQLLCLLGVGLASFAKASKVSWKMLGVRVDGETLRRLCGREGRRAQAVRREPTPMPPGTDLVGSCDGTLVHTRESGWREVKAYLFEHAEGRLGGAHLEPAEVFTPRLRRAALALRAGRARRILFVSDAAEWIEKGVRVQLPMAKRIVDLWHACQHVHAAGRDLYPKDEAKGRRWAERWCLRLRADGGRAVLYWLRRVRLRSRSRRRALGKLLVYLANQADRLDYPTYEALGYPISSGSMESFCKQLGARLKGPGMRWATGNVDPLAALVTLWTTDQWDPYWQTAA
jgi:hypothetical protein